MEHRSAIGILFLVVIIAGPLLLGLAGLSGRDRAGASVAPAWDWRVSIRSALLYALAFNIVFFIQELFLVLPKALVPGLRPTLYHNNHQWEGDQPIAALFQGTGALAILITGLLCAWLTRSGAGRTADGRLFIVWMAYHGLFQSLPQIVVGAIVPQNDTGMAMDYLAMSPAAKSAAALAAMAAIVAAGLWLSRQLLALADDARWLAHPGNRSRFILRIATLPALTAIPLIIAFRVPRELVEVVVPPVVVTIVGIGWIQADAWRAAGVAASTRRLGGSLTRPLAALVGLLLFFQLVLRPGIPFF